MDGPHTHDLLVVLDNGDTFTLPSSHPGETSAQVARDLAHRLKPDVCLWGEIDEDEDLGEAVIVPSTRLSFVAVRAVKPPRVVDVALPDDQPGRELIPPPVTEPPPPPPPPT